MDNGMETIPIIDLGGEGSLPKRKEIEYKQAPIGIMPDSIWKQNRFIELGNAINRYINAAFPIPAEWVTEYNKLEEEIKNHMIRG